MEKQYCPTCGCEVTVEGKTTKYYKPVNQPLTAVAWPSDKEIDEIRRITAVGFHENVAVKAFYKRLKQSAKAIDLEEFFKWYKPNHKLYFYDEPSTIIDKYNEHLNQRKESEG